jgi:hypothetical protein
VKPLSTILTIAVVLASLRDGFAQGFVNLDFESAQIIPLVGGPYINSIATTNALPGWIVSSGQMPGVITYNASSVGSTWVPEPGGLALAALGTLLLGFRRWRMFRKKTSPDAN